MNKIEITFIIIAIIAYIIGSVMFNIPLWTHITFIALILILLAATLVLK